MEVEKGCALEDNCVDQDGVMQSGDGLFHDGA